MKIFYDGSMFYGYHRQKSVPTVESAILDVLKRFDYIESPRKNNFWSASRTDKSVSALGNCFAFDTDKEIILSQINAHLPKGDSIICWASSLVEANFSPRYSGFKKYWYFLPIEVIQQMGQDLSSLKKIAQCFEGKHDYRLFAKRDYRETLRQIDQITVKEMNDSIVFEFIAESFLWEQIRRIVSYILNYPRLSPELRETDNLLKASTTIDDIGLEPADPRNLILVEHNYQEVNWVIDDKALKKLRNKFQNTYLKLRSNLIKNQLEQEFFNSIAF